MQPCVISIFITCHIVNTYFSWDWISRFYWCKNVSRTAKYCWMTENWLGFHNTKIRPNYRFYYDSFYLKHENYSVWFFFSVLPMYRNIFVAGFMGYTHIKITVVREFIYKDGWIPCSVGLFNPIGNKFNSSSASGCIECAAKA